MVLHILKCEAASTSLQLERPVWSAERSAWELAAARSCVVIGSANCGSVLDCQHLLAASW